MVRFSWHVEDGLHAYSPPGAYTVQKESSVRHAACEIELPQSKETLEAVITLPANYLNVEKVKETGIVIGHGSDESEWKGKLLTEIAVHLASNGHVVIRYFCKHKEQRRQRMFEKALDACATSPFARGVTQWVLAGYQSGGRVAAVAGTRCRGAIAGFIMLSYPLKEPMTQPAAKPRRGEEDSAPLPESSDSPLHNLDKPLLFLLGDRDEFCALADLRALRPRLAAPDVRVEVFEDADQDFKASSQAGKGPATSVLSRLCGCILDFVVAASEDSWAACQLTKLAGTEADVSGKVELQASSNPVKEVPAEPPQVAAEPPQIHSPPGADLQSSAPPAQHKEAAIAAQPPINHPGQAFPQAATHAGAEQQQRPTAAAMAQPAVADRLSDVYQHVLANPQHAQQLLQVLAAQRQQQASNAQVQGVQASGGWGQAQAQERVPQMRGPAASVQELLMQHMAAQNAQQRTSAEQLQYQHQQQHQHQQQQQQLQQQQQYQQHQQQAFGHAVPGAYASQHQSLTGAEGESGERSGGVQTYFAPGTGFNFQTSEPRGQ